MGFAGTDCGEAGVVLIPAHWGWSNDRIPPYPAAGGLLEGLLLSGLGIERLPPNRRGKASRTPPPQHPCHMEP